MSHPFRAWAPRATSVHVDVRAQRHEMRAKAGGWFAADVEAAGAGDDYTFRVDGGAPLPDPRSPYQPLGVHGPSRLVDHSAHAWRDSAWRGFPLRQAIVYELHVGTFTPQGTFAAAAQCLRHLRALGVNAVELMPVAEFAGDRGWGYDGVNLFAPHHAYGGPDGLKVLVDECHALEIAVIVDVVYNHLGPEGAHLTEFGPYLSEAYRTPWGSAMNFDGPDCDEVRAFVLDNAEMWLRDYHCDGLRLDAVHAIVDTSATNILEDLVARADMLRDTLGRDLWVIAESDANDPRLVRDRAVGGFGLGAQWNDDYHHSLHALLTGERNGYYAAFGPPEDVCTALRQAFVYTGQHSSFRRRRFGRTIGETPLWRFVGYAQNHDQVGNRALGERLGQLVSPGRARIAAALTLLAPFVPLLFQGEEWGARTPFQYFSDLRDAELSRAVSEGRRKEFAPFGWNPADVPDPQATDTFIRSRLDWRELELPEHARMLAWYQDLIALRRATPELTTLFPVDVRSWYDPDRALLVYAAAGLMVACNLGDSHVDVPEAVEAGLALASDPVGDEAIPRLIPDAVAVWRVSTPA